VVRTPTEADHSHSVLLRAFYERALQVRKHVLFGHADASLIHPNMSDGTSIRDAAAILDVDHGMIRWSPITQIISQADPSLKPVVDAVNQNYKNWVKTLFLGMQDLGDATDQDENTVRIAEELDIELTDSASDYVMAIKVLNGEIFHVNLDYWVWMNQFPEGVVSGAYP